MPHNVTNKGGKKRKRGLPQKNKLHRFWVGQNKTPVHVLYFSNLTAMRCKRLDSFLKSGKYIQHIHIQTHPHRHWYDIQTHPHRH